MASETHRNVETPAFMGMVQRCLRAAARRVGGHHAGDVADVEALADLAEVRRWLDIAEQMAVDGARSHGESWESIGRALGTSRQAAYQRFDVRRIDVPEWWTVPPE